ncbi:MAG TPA: PEP-CTERM sorting domain-containing protein [Candidatus Angelobacter sp.]|nr:PEP-CTERM sorting domain-containing protein [Candidatus Angelobacter sp.]
MAFRLTRSYVRSSTAICFLVMLAFATTQFVSAQVYSVAFKTNNPAGNTGPVSGPEAAATAANSAFGGANVWNNVFSPYALETNPSWSNLLDSTGASSSVSLSITGTVGAVDFAPWEPAPDPIRTAFLFWNSWQNGQGAFGAGESTNIAWQLTGLQPNATYAMFFYGALPDTTRYFDVTIGGNTQQVWSYNDSVAHPLTGTLFATVYSNASGAISGTGEGIGNGCCSGGTNEADWSGFQIAELSPTTPEPSSLILLGSGVVGVLGTLKRKLAK